MNALVALAVEMGALPEYRRIDGARHELGPETAAALLAAMGAPMPDEAAAAAELARRRRGDAPPSPREIVMRAGAPADFDIPGWRLALEGGGEIAAADRAAPPVPAGAHRLTAPGAEALVVAAPARAPDPRDRAGRDRAWGVWTALYGLRSARNAGLGDYEDLARAAEALAGAGADFLGVNPVHARGLADPGHSPYSPSSRTGFDVRHIAIDAVPEFAACAAARALMNDEAGRVAAARRADLVDYGVVDGAILPALRALFDTFRQGDPARLRAFADWRAARAPEAALQSVFEALSTRHGPDWRRWPAPLQDAAGPEVAAFAAAHEAETAFHEWLQWTAEAQLAAAQRRARAAGMALGLYLDIAVGVRPGGAETWANPRAFASGVSLGAPPDRLSVKGQSWSLAPYSPPGLRAEGYASFRRMLRATMARAGVVRIDHIIGFARSYWAPETGAPGGYVAFPLDVLLALTRIEAARAGCVVVGEDLGTVPEGLRAALDGAGLYGCAIMPFERRGEAFLPPDAYRTRALAAFGTHDLPSLAGWWGGLDLDERERLGHLSREEAAADRAARGRDRVALCRLLEEAGLAPPGLDPQAPPAGLTAELADAVHAALAACRSRLTALGLDDIFVVETQQNVPGTVEEAPNWRRRAPLPVEALAAAPEIARAAAAVARGARIAEERR